MNKFNILFFAVIFPFFGFSQNEFTFDLFSKMNNENNILFSPTSIKTAFAMAYEGANNQTQKEFEKVFGFEENNETFIDEMEHLKSVTKISNSIWILEDYTILKSYTSKLKTNFNSKPFSTDFKNDPKGSAKRMNNWIDKSTNGMIKKMLNADDVVDFKMALVNAIYFKQNWKRTFNSKLTKKMDFHNLGGAKTSIDMMHNLSNYQAYNGSNEKVIELPYEDDKTSMVIILPNDIKNYEMTNEVYSELNTRLTHQKVNLDLPKFTFETPTFELESYLKAMGLSAAFENYADFSGMRLEKDLNIGTALHKAKIIVNEEGTEAAAVTVIGMAKTTSMPSPITPILKITVDKPFYYFIKDNQTGTILFMGLLNNM